ncbi:MAG TPA: PAS domain S-box protein [Telluria sp.]|nr:PAS domain S-box protein [Telluria sp.]
MLEQDVPEVGYLRQVARDLVAISTLPSVWSKLSSQGVLESLSKVLFSTLDLDLAYARLPGVDTAAALEAIRTGREDTEGLYLEAVRAASALNPASDAVSGPITLVDPVSGGPMRICVARISLGHDMGAIVCSCDRSDFPSERERLLIGVAANQAAVVLQRCLTEEALQRSESRFLDLANAAPAMLWVTEPDGARSFLSREWYAFTGQSAEQGLGFGWTEAVHPEDRQAASAAFLKANAEKKEFSMEHRLQHADGSYRWVIDAGRPRFSADGRFLGFVGNVLDITGHKQTEQALHATQGMLSAVFEALPVGIAVANQEGEVLFSNREMQQFMPTNTMPALDNERHHRWRAFHADGRPYAPTDFPGVRALQGERVAPGIEILYTTDNGTEIWTQFAAVPLQDGSGAPNGQVSIITNIDAFKRTEAALRLSEANHRALFEEVAKSHKNLSEFLAVLAHELRNPLAPILTGLEIMRMRVDSVETVTQVRGIIERQVKQLSHLINDLLDIARVTNGKIDMKKESVDLKAVVSNAVETSLPQIEKGQHEFSMKLDPSPLPVSVDAARIAQVISNLLTNAAKYTPNCGKIELSVQRDGDEAVISVRDTGIGIPPESLESVFDMFSQVGRNMPHSQGGLGIGLSLVRQLVALHGGTAAAFSEGAGTGSTFVVRLPVDLSNGAAGAGKDESGSASAPGKAFRILVTDDNVDAATTLASLLAMHGHELQIAHDGTQALQIAEEFRPDVVFLDIGMPGITGYEVARQLRARGERARCILVAVSGWGTKEDLIRSKEAGFDMHFTKPVAPARVRDFLRSLN